MSDTPYKNAKHFSQVSLKTQFAASLPGVAWSNDP